MVAQGFDWLSAGAVSCAVWLGESRLVEGTSEVKHFSSGTLCGELLIGGSTGTLEVAELALPLSSARNGTGFQPLVEAASMSVWSVFCSGPISGFGSEDLSSVSPASLSSLSGEVRSLLRSVSSLLRSASCWSRLGELPLEPLPPPLIGEGLISDDCLSLETDLDFDLFLLGDLEIERILLLGDLECFPLHFGDLDFER